MGPRLAIDLKPNPADIAKLKKLEVERTHLMRQGDCAAAGQRPERFDGAGGGRRHGSERHDETDGRGAAQMAERDDDRFDGFCRGRFARAAGDALYAAKSAPPRRFVLRLCRVEPEFRFAAAFRHAAGSGRRDIPSPARRRTPGWRADLRATTVVTHTPLRSSAKLPLAPVVKVRPLPAPSQPVSGVVDENPRRPPPQTNDATELPDGMWIASVQFVQAGVANVRIGLRLEESAAVTPQLRESLVRNAFRAARRVFDNYEAVQRIVLTAQASPSATVVSLLPRFPAPPRCRSIAIPIRRRSWKAPFNRRNGL